MCDFVKSFPNFFEKKSRRDLSMITADIVTRQTASATRHFAYIFPTIQFEKRRGRSFAISAAPL